MSWWGTHRYSMHAADQGGCDGEIKGQHGFTNAPNAVVILQK